MKFHGTSWNSRAQKRVRGSLQVSFPFFYYLLLSVIHQFTVHRVAPKSLDVLDVNFSEPLSGGWSFHDHLRREAGTSFKVKGQIPPALEQVSLTGNEEQNGSNTALTSGQGAGSAACPLAGDANGSAADGQGSGLDAGPSDNVDGSAAAGLNTTGLGLAAGASGNVEGPSLDVLGNESVAAGVKERSRGASAKARRLLAEASANIALTGKPRSKRPAQRKKSDVAPTAPVISLDTSTLVKNSLREHYWLPVRIKMVKSVSEYPRRHRIKPLSGTRIIG